MRSNRHEFYTPPPNETLEELYQRHLREVYNEWSSALAKEDAREAGYYDDCEED